MGEGLNTAFNAMLQMHLQKPIIKETDYSVLVIIKHERLADAESIVMYYLETHSMISNSIARGITGITDANKIKKVFYRLRDSGNIRIVDGIKGSATLFI